MGNMDICIKNATQFTVEEINQFKELLKKGGQVDPNTIEKLLHKNPVLAMIFDNKRIISIGCMKIPFKNHKKYVFEKSKSTLNPNDYSLELGWLVTDENYRRKGYCELIIQELLVKFSNKKIYATTQQNNEKIQSILEKNNFKISGQEFPSKIGNYKLLLWV